MRNSILISLLCFTLLCTGCTTESTSIENSLDSSINTITNNNENSATRDLFAMDTYMNLTAYGSNAEQAVDKAVSCINDLDKLLSTGLKTSEISQLNDSGNMILSSDASIILENSIKLYDNTNGAFNPLMYPIMEAWGFPTKEYKVPEEDELNQLLTLTDMSNLKYKNSTGEVSFNLSGMKVDFGGIAKGYTSSKVRDCFISSGVTSGIISLGGNVQAIGKKPDGSMWRVGVQNPDSEGNILGVLKIQDKAVITSGGYERYFEQDGKTYHHIIDPSTGMPADSGLTSVTIISDNGTLADGLSTALFVMGLEKASDYWRDHYEEFDAVFFTDDKKLYITEGIQENFSSDYTWNTIDKEY